MKHRDDETSRRNWLTDVARYAMLGGIAVLAWKLIARSGADCIRSVPSCHDCRLLAACRLPRANRTRKKL